MERKTEYAPEGQVPEFINERNDSREKITVWAGLCGNGTLFGLYIFDGYVNGYNSLQIINDFISLNCKNISVIISMATSSICCGFRMELQHIAWEQ